MPVFGKDVTIITSVGDLARVILGPFCWDGRWSLPRALSR